MINRILIKTILEQLLEDTFSLTFIMPTYNRNKCIISRKQFDNK